MVFSYGGIELLRVGETFHSRTRKAYASMHGLHKDSLCFYGFYLKIPDYRVPKSCRLVDPVWSAIFDVFACVLEGDDEEVYWCCGCLADRSIVVMDGEGSYYHVEKGKGKRYIACNAPKAGEADFASVVEGLRKEAGRRIVCLSAILPDGHQLEDFAAWLTRDQPDGLIKDDWRPTRLRFGEVEWKGQHAQLNVSVGDEKPFIPKFVVPKRPTRGRARKLFPADQGELCIATAWRLVEEGQTVLVFCPMRRSVLPLAATIIEMHKRGHIDSMLAQPVSALATALAVGTEWFGPDHDILACLKLGVAVHHGALPTPYRKEVERLLREGVLRVTVSSPTLAQGLNLAATSLVFRGVRRGRAVLLLNKPYGMLCQFTREGARTTLADVVAIPDAYPAGRLDADSEGLVVLTAHGPLQARIADPRHKAVKTYWTQVEGTPTPDALAALVRGVTLNDGPAYAVSARAAEAPPWLWPRVPPIRERRAISTAWLVLELAEGRNRQVRRMTAAVGLPTLRLVREKVGPWTLGTLAPGEGRVVPVL